MEVRGRDDTLTMIPDGTMLYEPDERHCVVVVFPTATDAKRFFEFVKCLHGGPSQLLTDGGNT